MLITQRKVKIKDLVDGYSDLSEQGCFAYGGRLNIRPPYQREFVYNDEQQKKVIQTVAKKFPLNIIYWAKNPDGNYEVIDGQQRIISICRFMTNKFSVPDNYLLLGSTTLHNFEGIKSSYPSLAKQIEDYELTVYICDGPQKEKLGWFETINIAGEKLNEQELRNAVYTGSWLASAKTFFSKTNCPASRLAQSGKTIYIKGISIRQELLEKVLEWKSEFDYGKKDIIRYMSEHQHDNDASELIKYFEDVIKWIKANFTTYRKEMASVDWGSLYNKYYTNIYNASDLEDLIKQLYLDNDVQKKVGIYEYVLARKAQTYNPGQQDVIERLLNIRAFDSEAKRIVYESQTTNANAYGVSNCTYCAKNGGTDIYSIDEMEADHIIPWSQGGKTVIANCQCLCKKHNRMKSDK